MRRLSSCSSGEGSIPSSSTSVRRALRYASSASAWRPDRYSASISCPRGRSRSGCSAIRGLQLRNELGAAPHRQIGLDPSFQRGEPELLEALGVRERERVVAEVGERGASPESEGFYEHRAR